MACTGAPSGVTMQTSEWFVEVMALQFMTVGAPDCWSRSKSVRLAERSKASWSWAAVASVNWPG